MGFAPSMKAPTDTYRIDFSREETVIYVGAGYSIWYRKSVHIVYLTAFLIFPFSTF
jgi:hypothetical protein